MQLGTDLAPWTVTASLVIGTSGHADAKLEGTTTVSFINGTASFSDLQITHQGSGYKLKYHVSYPADSKFEIVGNMMIEIKERELGFRVNANILNAVEMFAFEDQPIVYVYDVNTGENLNSLGARGRKWILEAQLVSGNAELVGTTKVYFNQTAAQFTDLGVNKAGTENKMSFKVYTEPSSRYLSENQLFSNTFSIAERTYHLKVARSIGNCNDTITCGTQPIVEVRAQDDNIATHLDWVTKQWYITATLCQGDLLGEVFFLAV